MPTPSAKAITIRASNPWRATRRTNRARLKNGWARYSSIAMALVRLPLKGGYFVRGNRVWIKVVDLLVLAKRFRFFAGGLQRFRPLQMGFGVFSRVLAGQENRAHITPECFLIVTAWRGKTPEESH